jgi:hypothetical protein
MKKYQYRFLIIEAHILSCSPHAARTNGLESVTSGRDLTQEKVYNHLTKMEPLYMFLPPVTMMV